MIYLDYNATAPIRPEAAAAVAAALAAGGNPSSVHAAGREARRRVEVARETVASLIGAAPPEVVFTSGGTEANALALAGAGAAGLVVSAVEHDSVLAGAAAVDPACRVVPVDGDGVLDLAALAGALAVTPAPALVSVMLANNETGVLQPVAEVARLAHARGARVHCDAVQAAGRIPVDCRALDVDYLSLSAHKLGGPPGVGALVVCRGAPLARRQHGGGQEYGRRAGTENVAGIAGFAAAAEAALAGLAAAAGLAALRDRLERRLRTMVPALRVWGEAAARLPNTSCLGMPGVASETQIMAFDLAGIAVSAGAACSSGKVVPSHVLRAMGASAGEAGSAIRVSLGWGTTVADIDRFAEVWLDVHMRIAAAAAARQSAA